MWLPKPAYEALPWVLLCAGVLLGVAGYLSSADWMQSSAIVAASVLAIVGLVLLLKRRDYRQSRSRIKYDRLD